MFMHYSGNTVYPHSEPLLHQNLMHLRAAIYSFVFAEHPFYVKSKFNVSLCTLRLSSASP